MECQKCGATVSFYIGEPEICPECGDLMFEKIIMPKTKNSGDNRKKVYFNVPIYETLDGDDRWCPECGSELHYRRKSGHIYCMECDYERWED